MPDTAAPVERVALGATGHRGSAFEVGFNVWHALAIGQAICQYRKQQGIDGALFPGIDTHRQRRLHATGDIMKATQPLHDLGQGLWLDGAKP